MSKTRLMHVSSNFHKYLKLKAAEENKSIIDLTEEWASKNGITTKKNFFNLEEKEDDKKKKGISFFK